tara:strand:+ start:799 stop:1047 length:249 start_codon:yes stop_codon:yes gene_type:complete
MNRKETVYFDEEIIETIYHDVEWEEVRITRNKELENSDWRASQDVVMTDEWIEYRQFLRDLPGNYDSANDAADAWNEYNIPE